MPRRPKQGIEFAGWSVDIFDGDTKIDKLLDAQGWVGFGIYFFLCQMAYKFDGYFYRWSYDDSATTARRMSGGVGSKTVENTVGLCLQIGLFDKPLFDRHGILTSKGIQIEYAKSHERLIDATTQPYWLLDSDETELLFELSTKTRLSQTRKKQRDRNTTEYAKWRKLVFERDKYTCQMCGERGGILNAHHIERYRNNIKRRTDVSNGITLCVKCHRKLHKEEGM